MFRQGRKVRSCSSHLPLPPKSTSTELASGCTCFVCLSHRSSSNLFLAHSQKVSLLKTTMSQCVDSADAHGRHRRVCFYLAHANSCQMNYFKDKTEAETLFFYPHALLPLQTVPTTAHDAPPIPANIHAYSKV